VALLGSAHLLQDLVSDVQSSHALSVEVQELSLRIDEIEHDGVVHEVFLFQLLALIHFGEVDTESARRLIDLLLGSSEEGEGRMEV
jgi:hypothetical protein